MNLKRNILEVNCCVLLIKKIVKLINIAIKKQKDDYFYDPEIPCLKKQQNLDFKNLCKTIFPATLYLRNNMKSNIM